jgi:hypothetical protein
MYLNGKIISVEMIPGIREEKYKGKWSKGWIQVWYIWYSVRTFVSATMYPHPTQQ